MGVSSYHILKIHYLYLIFHGFHTWEFIYLLKFICDLSINEVFSWSFADAGSVVEKNPHRPTCMFPAEVKQGGAPHYVSTLITSRLFPVYLVPWGLYFCTFCRWFCCLKRPSSTAEGLCSVPKPKMAVMHLVEKTRALHKLFSRLSCRHAVGQFSVYESVIYIK